MNSSSTKWFLASACAALLAVPMAASARRPQGDSRHPDPRGRPERSEQRSGHWREHHRGPPPQAYYAYPVSYGYYPPPPPPIVYYPPPPPPPPVYCPPPRPVFCYPVYPGFNITLKF